MNRKRLLTQIGLFIIVLASTTLATACSSSQSNSGSAAGASAASMPGHSGHLMAAMTDLPEEVKAAPAVVQGAYSFAIANPDILKRLPCYCGCGGMGHNSLYACYVSSVEPSGKINFDSHALGCSICVDIAQDAMRQLNEGKTVDQIKAFVDQTYAQYGTSNLP